MGVVVVEVIEDGTTFIESVGGAQVTEVINTVEAPTETTGSVAVTEVVREGGTIVNVGWGYGLPSNPYVGQIWIDVS